MSRLDADADSGAHADDVTDPETPPAAEAPGRRPPVPPPGPPPAPPVDLGAQPRVLARRLGPVIHVLGFVRKEILAVLRQPRLLLVLVIGPFLLLFLFGLGYDQTQTVLRTAFVGPEDSVFADVPDRFDDELSDYVEMAGYTSDIIEAQTWLADGEIDLIVVFPADPVETVLEGDQAVIDVLHDKLDPIQQTAVNVSAQVAVQELNAVVVEQVIGELQSTAGPYQDMVDRSTVLFDDLEAASARSDDEEAARLAGEIEQTSAGLATVLSTTEAVRSTLGSDLQPEDQERLDQLTESVNRYQAATANLVAADGEVDTADLRLARRELDGVVEASDTVVALDPAVAVRPFRTDAENLLRGPVTINDFFAPAAIALLVQHMALTFAGLGLVRDRRLGLFELYRVGAVGPFRILLGKYLANLFVAGAVAAALLAAVHYLIGVPQRGEDWAVAVGMAGVITASIAAGLLLSLLARTDSQAVQYAMLALLAGLFFGGFLLELDAIRYPVKAISLLLPVTYGTNLLRDVMLRGDLPDPFDLAGLVATSFLYAALAWWLMARQLRLGKS